MHSRALVDPTRLVKLLGMLGSAHDGEVAAAGRKASEYLRQHGLQWSDVISGPRRAPAASSSPSWRPFTPWQRMTGYLQVHRLDLTAKEREFVDRLAEWRREPTDRQLAWLVDLYSRIAGAGR